MTSEEAARSLNLEHDLYLALLTEEVRREYESVGLLGDFFDGLSAEQKFDLIDDRQYRTKKKKHPQRLSEELECSACGGTYYVRGLEAHVKATNDTRWMYWNRPASPLPQRPPTSLA
jgi:hypothetical protein